MSLIILRQCALWINDLIILQAEQLAKDVELFAQHANRKSVNMEDVILSSEFC